MWWEKSPSCAHLNFGGADGGAASGMDVPDTLGGGDFLSQSSSFGLSKSLG